MQTPPRHKAKATELERILERWEQRYEWRQLSKALPRALIAALLISLPLGIFGYLRLRLDAAQLALLAGGICALGALLTLVYTLLFPRDLLTRARFFDLEFGLRERVSTAIELMQGRLVTHPELEARQIAEALDIARGIDAKTQIRMDFRRRELAALCLLALLMGGLILLPAIAGPAYSDEAPAAALDAPREDLREIIEAVAKDPSLDDIDRQQLLEALEMALERLQEEEISEEEAFAAMSQLAAELQEKALELGETVELDQSTMDSALQALEDYQPPAESDADSDAGSDSEEQAALENLPSLSQTMQQLAQDAAEMSAEEAAAAAEALRQAAEELAESSPELAAAMQSMAEALEAGDDDALQAALEAAGEQLAQAEAQNQRDQQASMLLQEQSEMAEQAAEAIARRQSQQGAPEPGAMQEPAQAGQQRSGQPSNQESAQAAQDGQQGSQPAQRNSSRRGERQGDNQDSRGAGAGAGSGDPSNRSLPGAGGADEGAETNNQTSGNREIEYEALYSPSGIEGGGNEELRLETDASDAISAEGDFDDNPLGESRVSYDRVFSEYQNAANRALESDYVPLGLRDVVRDYFTSLEPAGAGA